MHRMCWGLSGEGQGEGSVRIIAVIISAVNVGLGVVIRQT